jgi:hypothetical protein
LRDLSQVHNGLFRIEIPQFGGGHARAMQHLS